MRNLVLLEFIILTMALYPSRLNAFNCRLPEGCRIENVYNSEEFFNFNQKEFFLYPEIMCDINDKFEFSFKDQTPIITSDKSCFTSLYKDIKSRIIFKWTSSSNELNILEKRFNFTNVIRYLSFFKPKVYISFWSIKGFDVKFLGESYNMSKNSSINVISLSDCRLNFYHNKKKINSCQDFSDYNITQIASIFQISFNVSDITKQFEFKKVEYKENICPLLFNNSKIRNVIFNDLTDTFYKKNVLTFSNETYQKINSSIKGVILFNSYNVNIDLNLFHQSVFCDLGSLFLASGSIKSLSLDIIKILKRLNYIKMDPMIFKKINHKQGIEWIRLMNFGLNVNFSKEPNKQDREHFLKRKDIDIEKRYNKPHPEITAIIPDEDFCIYVDFPFNQLVVIKEDYADFSSRNLNTKLSCTYLWLVQYYEYYKKYLSFDRASIIYIRKVLNSTSFKSISKCNFEESLSRCNKSNYQPKEIWDESDFFILNKKLQTALKISLYPVSLLGLITNFMVVLVILIKHNNDLFKDYKQYNYLYINSIFCMMISVIELLSWMTECFYPFEVFCPEIRKLVAIQFFKIIFKECFVTVFRFMCNFTYIAFALNRISLIGKDHGKIVTFMSEVGIKKYIGVTFFISLLLSWMKYFQYEVNYYDPNLNFPLFDHATYSEKLSTFKDVFYIFNVISDLMNYFVFVIVSVVIDICMVVQLRRILDEKSVKFELMNQKQNECKKAEFDEAVNKAIQMVVLNSAIGIFFKLPTCIIPLINVFARFYYKNHNNLIFNNNFALFFQYLFDSGFYDLVQDISNFLFTFSLSIQLFIYYRFDKKFLIGFQRMMDIAFTYIKSFFKSKT